MADTYTKEGLYRILKGGMVLDEVVSFTEGQECQIYKAKKFPSDVRNYNDVIYIPDLYLNEIVCHRAMTIDELANAYQCFYTAQDFIDICGGSETKARMVFRNCDWQHPSTEYNEMDMEGEFDFSYPFGNLVWDVPDVIAAAQSKGVAMTDEQAVRWIQKNKNVFEQTLRDFGNRCLYDMNFEEV